MMRRRYVFDLETDGLLKHLTKVHCLVIRDVDSGECWSYADHPGYRPIKEGLVRLDEADELIGHNVIKFDLPALAKVYRWKPKPNAIVFDTLVAARVMWPRDILIDSDRRRVLRGAMPGKLVGAHSLGAWGYRLGEYKGDYDGGWESWSHDMQDYCEQDTEVTRKLVLRIAEENETWEWRDCLALEHKVAFIVARQERWGFAFNMDAAVRLWGELADRKDKLEKDLRSIFKPWFAYEGQAVPKRSLKYKDRTKASVTEGCAYSKVRITEFNPASRDHIANRLKALYQWEPEEFTPEGKPKVDEEVLSRLPYKEAKALAEYFLVEKRLGQLATGKAAWIRKAESGRIHGSVNTNGAQTGRMTHADPNLAQVPGVKALYGVQCRSLFMASAGMVLVGCDADALELRCLAGYMAAFDGGDYIRTVLEGKKEDGTDMHSINARILGCSREVAKVWFYAFIYGAGDEKLGLILGHPKGLKARQAGKRSRAKFLAGLPALGKITDKVRAKVRAKNPATGQPLGYVRGLDGRKLFVRSDHSALNTLLQGAGAILMKQGLVELDEALQDAGLIPGLDYEFCANVHDEWQIDVLPQHVALVMRLAPEAIRRAGETLNFRCPLAGNAVSGANWAETH